MTTIYHNPKCSKSRAALKTLQDQGLNPTVIEYQKAMPDRQQLARMIKSAGLNVHDAIRSKEPIYKQLGLSENNSDEELISAIINHPILLNRPFVVTSKGVRLARSPEVLAEIL